MHSAEPGLRVSCHLSSAPISLEARLDKAGLPHGFPSHQRIDWWFAEADGVCCTILPTCGVEVFGVVVAAPSSTVVPKDQSDCEEDKEEAKANHDAIACALVEPHVR